MIIIGFDPGYDRLGWGVLNASRAQQPRIVGCGCIQTSKDEPMHTRYRQILAECRALIQEHKPVSAAIESLIFNTNKTTAIRVSEVRGLLLSVLIDAGCQTAEYSPPQIKLAVTGFGRADKSAVAKMVRLQLGLTNPDVNDDTIDALAVALTHSLIYKGV